ncbi:uncharacterized protein LOC141639994 isoform X1 [Silene latifolia]|uniref:uncharacterized protein LOC141639994 isoform X1 n=1 Tax=Silene latifolia TaxID=37657 RepID=UPI003D77BB04
MLETAPSLSIYWKKNDEEIEGERVTRKVTNEGSGDFSFDKVSMDLNKEDEEEISSNSAVATGIGGEGLKDHHDFEKIMMNNDITIQYCTELLDDYPNHSMLLKKYADFLLGKGDLHGAEEYYFRASQANLGDGESLAQYAQLVWVLHHDHERALTYFDLAAQTASDNSFVMAAYAKFLWETEDDGEDLSAVPDTFQKSAHFHSDDGINVNTDELESYYKRMINDKPSDPTFLNKYAQYLYESKGDLEDAKEYYSRAVLVEPQNGEMLSQFHTLLWELYHDRGQTLNYLERAIEAVPQDCNVLAAYARILWIVGDE